MMQDPRMAVDAQGRVATANPLSIPSPVPGMDEALMASMTQIHGTPQNPTNPPPPPVDPNAAVDAMIQGAKAGNQQAYQAGLQMGIFDARLSPAAAAWYAEAQQGRPTAGAPSSILKELQDFAKLQTQETALADLLPEQLMQMAQPSSRLPQ
jgi:hypothetical protein